MAVMPIKEKSFRSRADIHAQWQAALKELAASQLLGVVSTYGEGGPCASLVAFAADEDLREIVFATPRTTRKYTALSLNSRVAFLMDNRANTAADFHRAVAATAHGVAEEIPNEGKDAFLGPYLARHPHLEEFVRAPSCALILIHVEAFSIVRRFQEVVELRF